MSNAGEYIVARRTFVEGLYQVDVLDGVLDQVGVVNPEQFRDIFEQLRAVGIEPVFITTENFHNLESRELAHTLIEQMGIFDPAELEGSISSGNFPRTLLLCLVDFLNEEAICAAGGIPGQYLSVADLETMEAMIVRALEEDDDPTLAIVETYQFALQKQLDGVVVGDEFSATLLAQEQPQPTPTAKVTNEPTTSAVLAVPPPDRPPLQLPENAREIGIGMGVVGALGAVIVAGALGYKTILRPKRELVRSLNEWEEALTKLTIKLQDKNSDSFYRLIGIIEGNDEARKEQLLTEQKEYWSALERVLYEANQLTKPSSTAQFSPRSELARDLSAYKKVVGQLEEFEELQDKVLKEALQLEALLGEADQVIDRATVQLERFRETYNKASQQHSYLPEPELALKPLTDFHLEMNQSVIDGAKLRGAQQAKQLEYDIQQVRQALTALLNVNQARSQAQQQIEILVSKWPEDSPSVAELLSVADWHINQALEDFIDDRLYEDVQESTQIATKHLQSAIAFCDNFQHHLDTKSKSVALIAHIDSRGFHKPAFVETCMESLEKFQQLAMSAVVNGNNWSDANRLIASAEAEATKVVTEYQKWVSLREINQTKLRDFSQKVAHLTKYADESVLPAWNTLKTFSPDNYDDILGAFDDAKQALGKAFDDPANESDLASQAERLNSMDQQQFDQAESALLTMEHSIVLAGDLLEKILERLRSVELAKREYQATYSLANRAIAEAKASYAGPLDRFVREATEEEVAVAQRNAEESLVLFNNGSVVKAYELVEQARLKALEAKQSADDQVRRVRQALMSAEKTIDSLKSLERELQQEYQLVNSVVLLTNTHELVQSALRLAPSAYNLFAQLASLEDDALFQATDRFAQSTTAHFDALHEAKRAILSDKEAHQRRMQTARENVLIAIRRIDEAKRMTSDPKANNAGVAELQSAERILPKDEIMGATYSQLATIILQAEESARYAEEAIRLAQAQIRRYEYDPRRDDYHPNSYSSTSSSSGSSNRPYSTPAPSYSSPSLSSSFSRPKPRPSSSASSSSRPSPSSSRPTSSSPRPSSSSSRPTASSRPSASSTRKTGGMSSSKSTGGTKSSKGFKR